MGDKFIMENLMYGSKVVGDLYLHGFIEATNNNVFVTFTKALQDTAKMHQDIFKAMEKSGMYTTKNVEESKIKKLKEKLERMCKASNLKKED